MLIDLIENHDLDTFYVGQQGAFDTIVHIEEQDKHDIALDKLSVKEYEDPFKGGK